MNWSARDFYDCANGRGREPEVTEWFLFTNCHKGQYIIRTGRWWGRGRGARLVATLPKSRCDTSPPPSFYSHSSLRKVNSAAMKKAATSAPLRFRSDFLTLRKKKKIQGEEPGLGSDAMEGKRGDKLWLDWTNDCAKLITRCAERPAAAAKARGATAKQSFFYHSHFPFVKSVLNICIKRNRKRWGLLFLLFPTFEIVAFKKLRTDAQGLARRAALGISPTCASAFVCWHFW